MRQARNLLVPFAPGDLIRPVALSTGNLWLYSSSNSRVATARFVVTPTILLVVSVAVDLGSTTDMLFVTTDSCTGWIVGAGMARVR